jgi:hypothetical protein
MVLESRGVTSLMSPIKVPLYLRHCSQTGNNPIIDPLGTGGALLGYKVPVLAGDQSPTCSVEVVLMYLFSSERIQSIS